MDAGESWLCHALLVLWSRCTFSLVGDHFQVIADVDATEAEAPTLAGLIVRWLASTGVIMDDATDCVLGTDPGYPPGPNFREVTNRPNEDFLSLWINGVEATAQRRVFHPGQGELGMVACSQCDRTVHLSDPATGAATDHWGPFGDALDTWYSGGSSLVRCPHCERTVEFNDWRWVDGMPFALGFLGLTFWNWPELSAQFVRQVADRLGHRVVVTGGKL